MLEGRIIRGIAGFYYVSTVGSGIYECKAIGKFRKNKQKPLVGDRVQIEILDEAAKTASLVEIRERSNCLIRPAVANVDQAMLLFALADPNPDGTLLDRFLLMMERQGVPVFICFNKADLDTGGRLLYWKERYRASGYRVISCSAGRGEGMDRVRDMLDGRTTVLAGPSGAGKSTLTNLLQDQVVMETGEISRKLKRGRHTTRHAELIPLWPDTCLCDTPGFTSLDLPDMEKEELDACFPDLRELREGCRFQGCAHISEPDCAVKRAVEEGLLSEDRYDNYRLFYQELREREKRRY